MLKIKRTMVGRRVTLVHTAPKMEWALNRRFYVVGRATVKNAVGAEVGGFLLNKLRGVAEGAFPALCWPALSCDGNSFVQWSEVAVTRQAAREKEARKELGEVNRLLAEMDSALQTKRGKK